MHIPKKEIKEESDAHFSTTPRNITHGRPAEIITKRGANMR